MRSTLLGALLAGGLALGLASPADAQVMYSGGQTTYRQAGGYQYGSATGYTTQNGGYYARSNGYATRPGYPALNRGYGGYTSAYRGYTGGQPGYGGGYSNTYSGYNVGRGQGVYMNNQRRGFMRFR